MESELRAIEALLEDALTVVRSLQIPKAPRAEESPVEEPEWQPYDKPHDPPTPARTPTLRSSSMVRIIDGPVGTGR